ncbi:hypothetical protein TNCV_1118951 [Trichonephila clavipes]|uniref:Uncharacterized protein n=1 Tax=Trichonephila clavipes TaxID=2585209 RepID=A0A8X6T5H0_TRICX|nr:hypothetical protein TNCV_1118951 [Trichonephila clavipes]
MAQGNQIHHPKGFEAPEAVFRKQHEGYRRRHFEPRSSGRLLSKLPPTGEPRQNVHQPPLHGDSSVAPGITTPGLRVRDHNNQTIAFIKVVHTTKEGETTSSKSGRKSKLADEGLDAHSSPKHKQSLCHLQDPVETKTAQRELHAANI